MQYPNNLFILQFSHFINFRSPNAVFNYDTGNLMYSKVTNDTQSFLNPYRIAIWSYCLYLNV